MEKEDADDDDPYKNLHTCIDNPQEMKTITNTPEASSVKQDDVSAVVEADSEFLSSVNDDLGKLNTLSKR